MKLTFLCWLGRHSFKEGYVSEQLRLVVERNAKTSDADRLDCKLNFQQAIFVCNRCLMSRDHFRLIWTTNKLITDMGAWFPIQKRAYKHIKLMPVSKFLFRDYKEAK